MGLGQALNEELQTLICVDWHASQLAGGELSVVVVAKFVAPVRLVLDWVAGTTWISISIIIDSEDFISEDLARVDCIAISIGLTFTECASCDPKIKLAFLCAEPLSIWVPSGLSAEQLGDKAC